jgi:hypothetical protein
VPSSGSADEGHDPVSYKIRSKKVSSLDELYKEMGVTQADYDNGRLTNGQKTLVDTFKMATSDAITSRTEHAFNRNCDVYLFNSDDFDNNSNVSNYIKNAIKNDTWPCSMNNGKAIRMSSSFFCKQPNTDSAVSTFVHEYSHTLDKTIREPGSYGQDNTHMIDEITTKKAAFKEAWAEYNEMIEFNSTANKYLEYSTASASLCIESTRPGEIGVYSEINATDCSADQLLSSEMFVSRMLYQLHVLLGKDSNGKDIVSNAFYATNGEETEMTDLVKQLIRDNPGKAKDIIKIVDQVTLNKMTNDELTSFVGNSEALTKYLETRNSGSSTSTSTSTTTTTTVENPAQEEENDESKASITKKFIRSNNDSSSSSEDENTPADPFKIDF